MAISIRSAVDSDLSALAKLRAEEWGDESFWLERIARYRSGEHFPQQALRERELLVALENGTVLGLVAGHQTRRFGCDGELQWINVAKHRQGEGIGGKLLARMGAWFVEHDADRICVNVAAENTSARRLYASSGAKPFKESWMIWESARSMGGKLSADRH